MIRVYAHRIPTHLCEMLMEEFSIPVGISPQELAMAICLPEQHIN